jgi:HK97 gp10 family phage protein
MINININNSAFISTSNNLKKGANPLITRVITRVATYMEREAKKNLLTVISATPAGEYRRTGKSRQSIMRAPTGKLQQRVFMGVDYGKYIEEGTGIYIGRKPWYTSFGGLLDHPIYYKGMPARPFWKPAIEATKQNIPRIIREESKKQLM